jgi:transposase-like protein
MSKRNTYTSEYKAKIVIEILEGEQTISEIASREGINVNHLKNWKKEFLENASRAFNGSKSEKNAKKASENAKKCEERLMQKIGHLTVQVEWLKKI